MISKSYSCYYVIVVLIFLLVLYFKYIVLLATMNSSTIDILLYTPLQVFWLFLHFYLPLAVRIPHSALCILQSTLILA